MKYIFACAFLFLSEKTFSQTFLNAYKDFYTIIITKDQQLDSLIRASNKPYTRKNKKRISKIKRDRLELLSKQVLQFDTIFQKYKAETGFDFNNADSLIMIYQTSIETNLRDYIIYSGNDTISYGESWKMASIHSMKKEIVYKPFLDTVKRPKGLKVITDRDSLLTIASKRNCGSVQLLANESKVFDGATSTIIMAKRVNGQYYIEECFLPPFAFVPIWRKE